MRRRFVPDRGPGTEQEFGVGVRRLIRLGQAVTQHQLSGAFGRVMHLADRVADPTGEANAPGCPSAGG